MPQSLDNLIRHLKPYWLDSIQSVGWPTEGPGIDVIGTQVGFGGDSILLYNSDGSPVEEYSATATGAVQAFAAATAGNEVIFPYNITIAFTSGLTIPAGVIAKNASLTFSGFTGNGITMSDGSAISDSSIYFDGAGQVTVRGIYASGISCNIGNTIATAKNATNNIGIYGKGSARHVGVNIINSTGLANDGSYNYGLYLEEYSYAFYSLGEASSINTNAGIFMAGSVAGEYNAPVAFACFAFGSQSDNSFGLRVDDNKYGTAVNCHLYGLKADGSDAYGVEVRPGATFYSFGNTWTNLTVSGAIEYLPGDRVGSIPDVETVVVNPHVGTVIDECTVRGYVDGKVYWSSHRAQGLTTALGYEYAYNTLSDANAEIGSQAGQAGWQAFYNATNGLIYSGGEIYADSITYRSAVWTIDPTTGTVSYTPINAAGNATGDINELMSVCDDGTQLLGGERGAGGLTTGSDHPNGGGLWTIPKATIGTPATFTRVYEDSATPKREWRYITKLGSKYIALLVEYGAGKYVIQSSTDLTTWNVDVNGMALSLNDIYAGLVYHPLSNKVYAATVNSSRQIVLRWYDGSSWSSTTFANLTVPATGMVTIVLETSGNNLIMFIAEWTTHTHSVYFIYNLDATPNYLVYATGISGGVFYKAVEAGLYIYYATCYPGGLNRIRTWGANDQTILFSDSEGDPADVDRTARADGTSTYAARRDHRHELGTVNLDHLSDVDTTGTGTGDIIYNSGSGWVDYPLGIGSKISVTSNKLRIGNGSGGNYLEIDLATGNLRLAGDATAWDDLRVSADVVKPGATAPAWKAFGPSGSLQALMFEAGHHDEAYFIVQLPHAWKEGSNIHPHIHWTPTTADAGNVVWELEYSWANIGGTFGAPGNMATVATAAGGVAWVHKMSDFWESGNEYISGAGKTISSMLVCRLHRNSNAGSDTLNKDVAFLEIDFHYEIDSFGSDTELVKDTSSALLMETGDYLLLENGDNLLLE